MRKTIKSSTEEITKAEVIALCVAKVLIKRKLKQQSNRVLRMLAANKVRGDLTKPKAMAKAFGLDEGEAQEAIINIYCEMFSNPRARQVLETAEKVMCL